MSQIGNPALVFTVAVLCLSIAQLSCNSYTANATSHDTLTWHGDPGLMGQNLSEVVLTTANVNQNQFGKVFSYPVDGQTFTEPLYVSDVPVVGVGTRNVVYVGTQNDTMYAFDADGGSTSPLWSVNSTNASVGITPVPLVGVSGIVGTPVIDATSRTLYVVAATVNMTNGTSFHHLHALDLSTGKEKFGGPVLIQGSVPGIGSGKRRSIQSKRLLCPV